MSEKMDWNRLLSVQRWGYKKVVGQPYGDDRSEFQRDYDRLIFSSAFRRLQNKTQVFPLPGPVSVHNRLTHSLEVASVGRSIGRLFYNLYKEHYPDVDKEIPNLQDIGDVISAACLCHDLGNPAFGHSGEAAISSYFAHGKGQDIQKEVNESEWEDLISFEGNANALRLLTFPFRGKNEKGFALTYATLASVVKYPCLAKDGHVKNKHHRKKYGFFCSEEKTYFKIAHALGILKDPENPAVYVRHPLVYMVEAADDICYTIIDLEDAHRLKILTYPEVEDLLLPLCEDTGLKQRLSGLEDAGSKVELLRAKAINTLINDCALSFFEHRDAILSGTFNSSLLDSIDEKRVHVLKEISEISIRKIYNAPTVVKIEVAGYKVMNALLEEFIPAVVNKEKTGYDKKLLAMIPLQFNVHSPQVYDKIRAVLDFVSGMTDDYAVDLYRTIKGITIPSHN